MSTLHRLRACSLLLVLATAGAQATPFVVTVSDAQGAPVADAVVSIHVRGARPRRRPGTAAEMTQRRRRFEPAVLAVQQGTAVSFPNLDTVRHHVYSFSPTKTFVIKLYAATPAAPVLFDRPGTAVLGCNIHDTMLAHVRVVDTPYFARTDAHGRAQLDVPPGSHGMKVWHAALGVEAEPSAQPVVVAAAPVNVVVRLPAPDMTQPPRLVTTRLRYRIVAVFVGMLLLVQLASLALVSHSIDRSARAAIETELATGQRVFERVLALRAARLADVARVLASDYGFRDAVASHDGDTLVSALDNHAQRIQAGVALFTDAKFQLKAATQPGAERFVPLLARMTGERDAPGHVVALDGEAYQLVVVPVKAPALIGWVTLGFPIDDALLGEVRQLSTVDVSLLWRHASPPRWEPMRSTLEAGASHALVGPWRGAHDAALGHGAATVAPVSLEFATRPATMTAGSHPVVAREIALARAGDGAPQVLALLMRSVDEATAPYDRLTAILLGCTLAAIAVFAVGSLVTAHRITTPLNRLARSARRLSQGVYDEVVAVPDNDEIGALAGAFESMRQAVQEREREVKRVAYEDRLTGLPNRERFRIEVGRAIDAARGGRGACAVLQLELERFEQINEVLGHRFGDALLREVARRLLAHGRRGERDVLARVGGNDFALVLPGADARVALELAEQVHKLLEQPIRIDDHTIDLGGAVGVACHPEHAHDADALAGRAAIAKLEARRRRMGVMLYDSVLDADSAESLSLMSELRHALAHEQLRLYLQPKIELATGAVIGAEALVRWKHPTRGLLPPAKFVPFAEQSGFIRELTAWVLARGTRLLKHLNANGHRMKLSVNLSTRDLLDRDLPARLRAMVATQGIDPRCLCLEITESAIMDDPQRAMLTLEALHDLGFKLSIDDFGTGYSSLAYLKSMPVDELKIDKSFVLNMERDLDDAKIVRSTVDLAHNLGLSVVAEGVENVKAWKLLQSLGCDEAQGYFIAKPMPEALFAEWIQNWESPALNAVRLDTDFARLAEGFAVPAK